MTNQLRSDTRERIIETARELFFLQGYGATGLTQILKTSEVNSGSLYHFFPTKEDLLISVLEKYKAMLEPAVLAPAFQRVSDPVERIFAVLDGYRQLLRATDFALGCPIGNLALETSNSHPQVRELVRENFVQWAAAIAQLIRESQLPTEDADALANYVLATMEGAVMLARAHRTMEPFDHAIAALRNHFELLQKSASLWGATQETT